MNAGTNRRTRALTLRRRRYPSTRDLRPRSLPTDHCHAALRRLAGAIREYQSDSSSKRPASSVAFGPSTGPPPRGRH
jgi:hypothetical protein